MRVTDYLEVLEDLRNVIREIDEVLNEVLVEGTYENSRQILEEAKADLESELDEMYKANFEPTAFIINLLTENVITLKVGETHDLFVQALLSNGTLRDVSMPFIAHVHFRDYDTIFNNAGLLLSVDASKYVFETQGKYKIIKTVNGWSVTDSKGTLGLQIRELGDNEYEITDYLGDSLGVTFKTDGKESVGDNWVMDIVPMPTGTEYDTDDFDVISVNPYGEVEALSEGFATVSVTNGVFTKKVSIHVVQDDGETGDGNENGE